MTLLVRQEIGDKRVSVIRDGGIEFPPEVFPDLSSGTVDRLLSVSGAEAVLTSFNCLLVQQGEQTILVDAGCRDVMGPDAGKLPEALAEAGVAPEDIGILVITHLHPDHISGAITADGQQVFPESSVILHDAEYRYWTDDGNFSNADDGSMEWRSVALDFLEAYGGQLQMIDSDKTEIASGITSVDLPGHTPGHVGLLVESGNDALFYGTDIYHAEGLQLPDVEVCAAFDLDPDLARATRRSTFDMLASERLLMSAGHMLAPALGYMEKTSSGYSLARA